MVQKSNIIRKSNILITFGLTNFEFNRLINSLKKLNIFEKENKLSPEVFIYFIKNSKKIISHAGPGTIYLITKNAKYMPLIIPRMAKFKEHVDDHQVFFAKFLKKKLPKKLKKYIVIKENIDKDLINYLKEKPKKNILKKYLFNKSKNSKSKIIFNQLIKNL